MRLLEIKGLLNIVITQNIDGLEITAGVSNEKMVAAHGNLKEAHCPKCKKEIDLNLLEKHIKEE